MVLRLGYLELSCDDPCRVGGDYRSQAYAGRGKDFGDQGLNTDHHHRRMRVTATPSSHYASQLRARSPNARPQMFDPGHLRGPAAGGPPPKPDAVRTCGLSLVNRVTRRAHRHLGTAGFAVRDDRCC
jgi:hypothetical protein